MCPIRRTNSTGPIPSRPTASTASTRTTPQPRTRRRMRRSGFDGLAYAHCDLQLDLSRVPLAGLLRERNAPGDAALRREVLPRRAESSGKAGGQPAQRRRVRSGVVWGTGKCRACTAAWRRRGATRICESWRVRSARLCSWLTCARQITVGVSDGERVYAARYASGPVVNSLFVSADARSVRALSPEEEQFQQLSDEARAIVSEPRLHAAPAGLKPPGPRLPVSHT